MRVGSLALLTLGALSLATSVEAQVDDRATQELERGQRLYAELDFGGAVDALERALAVPGIGDALRIEALELLGSSYVALDRRDAARGAFRAMLQIDPYHVLQDPSGSPRLHSAVEEIRRELVTDAALDGDLRLVLRLPRAVLAGRSVDVRVTSEGGRAPSRVTIRFRASDELEWQSLPATPGTDGFGAALPAQPRAGGLEIYAEAYDERSRIIARAGEPLFPRSVTIGHAEEGEEPLVEQWWLWTLVGVAVVAIGVGVGLGVGLREEQPEPRGTLAPFVVAIP